MSMQQADAHACVQIVTAWNGLAIGALAKASRVLTSEPDQVPRKLFPVEGRPAKEYVHGESGSAPIPRTCEGASAGFGYNLRRKASTVHSLSGMLFPSNGCVCADVQAR